jgi:hypothetical protein
MNGFNPKLSADPVSPFGASSWSPCGKPAAQFLSIEVVDCGRAFLDERASTFALSTAHLVLHLDRIEPTRERPTASRPRCIRTEGRPKT